MTIDDLIERLENGSEDPHDLGVAINEHFEIASYITDDGNPVESIDAAVALCQRVLPGWAWRVATCCVSDDAWVFPDFNSPEHGDRLKREFDQKWDWSELADVDLRPAGRPATALVLSILRAKQIIEEAA